MQEDKDNEGLKILLVIWERRNRFAVPNARGKPSQLIIKSFRFRHPFLSM